MNQALTVIGHEVAKDKYLAFLLVIVLLWAYIHTHNEQLLQLLVVGVGVLGGLMRSGTAQQNIASGDNSTVKTDPEAKT